MLLYSSNRTLKYNLLIEDRQTAYSICRVPTTQQAKIISLTIASSLESLPSFLDQQTNLAS